MAFLKPLDKFLPGGHPDKDKNPRAWETSWANHIAMMVPNGIPPMGLKMGMSLTRDLPPSHLASIEDMILDACESQTQLINAVREHGGLDAFEKDWAAATQGKREDAILGGLLNTCRQGLETIRAQCPDLTLQRLAANDGALVVRRLREITAGAEVTVSEDGESASVVVSKPVFLHDSMTPRLKQWEAESPDIEQPLRLLHARRTTFFSSLMCDIYLIFRGVDVRKNTTEAPVRRENFKKFIARKAGKSAAKTLLDSMQGNFDRLERRMCRRCLKLELELPDGEKLRSCSGCRKVGKVVLYCSQECQKQDWKAGNPTPHRNVCGKA